MKRLLFLCQALPYPPDGGVKIRSYNVLRLLSREFAVTALCFYRRAEAANPEELRRSINGLKAIADVEAFPIPSEHSKARFVLDHLRSVTTSRAYTISSYETSHFRMRLRELIETQAFDLVHLDSLDLAGYIPMLSGFPVVCVHHNVESALLQRRAETMSGLLRAYVSYQARLTEKEERRWCPFVQLNVTVSEIDRVELQKIAPAAQFIVIPNGVDTHAFRYADRPEPEHGIVFVGGYSWQPNRDAMEHFCLEVLPLLRARGISAKVTWVGRAPDAIKREYAKRYGIHLTGYVDDIQPIVRGAACYVAPLRAGGGTRLKILDAWAMGKAVVSTTVGCEGLDARDGENILVRDTTTAFAEAVEAVLSDSELRRRLGAAARQTAETQYDWEVIGKQMLPYYRNLSARGRRLAKPVR